MATEKQIKWAVGIGSVAAFLLGFRRLAGAAVGIYGAREVSKGNKKEGFAELAAGASIALFPSWPEDAYYIVKGKLMGMDDTSPPQLPSGFRKTSSGNIRDVLIDGGYTVLDVSETQSQALAQRAAHLNPGDIVNIVLQANGGDPTAYATTVIAGKPQSGEQYIAKWTLRVPPGAPQFVEYSSNHVFSAH